MEEEPAFCPSCGEVLPILAEKNRTIRQLQDELTKKVGMIERLKGDRNDRMKDDPYSAEAWEVYEHWRLTLRPKAREFSFERRKAVTARLRAGYSVEELKQAVDGAKVGAYVDEKGKRFDDLELICRNEGKVQRFLDYAPKIAAPVIALERLAMMQSALDDPIVLQRLHELRGWTEAAVLELGLGLDEGQVVFPVRDAGGTVVGVHHYQPNPQRRNGRPKLIARGARDLFPAPESIEAPSVWLVEGEPDAVAMRSAQMPAVAVPGIATWKDGWARRFEKFARVWIAFDCDEEGRKAAAKRRAQLAATTRPEVVDLAPSREDGYDIGDLLLEHGEGTGSRLSALAKPASGRLAPSQPSLGERPFERFCGRLEAHDCRVRYTGQGEAQAQCPNHDDRDPSLHITESPEGIVLLKCFTDCPTAEICAAVDFPMRELWP